MSVIFRGGRTCTCVAESLPWVEYDMIRRGLIKQSIDVFQLGYNNGGVAQSAGTHDAGGCTDVGQYSDEQIRVWRLWGWTMQHRTPAQGFSHHAHGWPRGCTHLSAGAKHQAWQWENGTNGLVSYGPITGLYPIKNWQTALKENFYKMFTLNDIKKAMGDVLDSRLDDIAKKVLNKDGVIPNTFTNNTANKYVSLATAMSYTGDKVDAGAVAVEELKTQVADLKSQVQALSAGKGTA